ncbi:MAG TPA: alkaline phosphatase family protein, partial [Thermomicrobiales bacterium]|nr:alkaline phosphatase family protein [Thermomicrobiales bacterium]
HDRPGRRPRLSGRMMAGSARVALLSLDSFDPDLLSSERTPHIWALAQAGGVAPDGGRADLPAVTYVSHATLLTGRRNLAHGVTSNLAGHPRAGVVPGWAGATRVQTPSLFEACRAAGVRSAAVFGDQYLHRILGAEAADASWPPAGDLPAGAPVDPNGYAANEAIRPYLLRAAADPDVRFLFGHINEPDTWGHRRGPRHADTLAAYAAADRLVGETLAALRPDWQRTLIAVVSDHTMEPPSDAPPIDLLAHPAVRAVAAGVVEEGGSALLLLRDGVSSDEAGTALLDVVGVAGWRPLTSEALLVEGAPGSRFAAGGGKGLAGIHGGAGTTRTMAVVGGGHPAVGRIARAFANAPPHLADWAPTIAAVLGISLAEADGRDLSRG